MTQARRPRCGVDLQQETQHASGSVFRRLSTLANRRANCLAKFARKQMVKFDRCKPCDWDQGEMSRRSLSECDLQARVTSTVLLDQGKYSPWIILRNP